MYVIRAANMRKAWLWAAARTQVVRIAVGAQAGRKVITLQTLPASDPDDDFTDTLGDVAGVSLHTGVAAKAHERDKLERLCCYISGPAVSEKRLPLTAQGKMRYELRSL